MQADDHDHPLRAAGGDQPGQAMSLHVDRHHAMEDDAHHLRPGMPKSFATLAPKKVRFSYSTADQPVLQRAVIQAIEKIGGQRKLKKLYAQHQKNLK
ncbi:MAG: hypothetical protein IOC86_14865, partial [Aestuariivirga sp.]|nr:hypothetical protein [Aestuariivirga sp.]